MGNATTKAGAATLAGSATIAAYGLLTGPLAPAAELTATGGAFVGTVATTVGLTLKGVGSAGLWLQGNIQPIRLTVLQGVQQLFEKKMDMPDLPLGINDPLGNATEQLAGENPCP